MPFLCDSMEKREKKSKWATKVGNLGARGIVFSVFHAQILSVKIVIGQN